MTGGKDLRQKREGLNADFDRSGGVYHWDIVPGSPQGQKNKFEDYTCICRLLLKYVYIAETLSPT